MYEVYEVIDGRTYVYGTAPTRHKARKVARFLKARVRKAR